MDVLSVYRSEEKYLVDSVTHKELESALEKILLPDSYSAQGTYKVKSLYFDTLNDRDYYDKVNGVEKKKKIRLRTYGAGAALKLECKEKAGELQHKTSLTVSPKEAEAMTRGEYGWLLDRTEAEASRFYSILMLGIYRPAAMVEYDRRAFVYPEFHTRITFDGNIRYSEINFDIFDEDINYNYILPDGFVLEVKYDGVLTGFIKKILSTKSLTRVSYSKYQWSRSYLNS